MKAIRSIGVCIMVCLFIFGFLLCIGSVGTLDYMDACGEMISDSIFLETCIRAFIGLMCMAVPFFIFRKIEDA